MLLIGQKFNTVHTPLIIAVYSIDNIDNNEEIPQIEPPIKIKKPVSREKLEQSKYARSKGAEKKKEMNMTNYKNKKINYNAATCP